MDWELFETNRGLLCGIKVRPAAMHHVLLCVLAALLAGAILSVPADARHGRHHHSNHGTGSAGFALEKGDFAGPEGWSTYVSSEAGTAVEYPANVFSVKDEASGRESEALFRTQDGRAKLSVYSLPNDEREIPRSYIQRHLRIDPSRLTYKRITDRFFAISGRRRHVLQQVQLRAEAERKDALCVPRISRAGREGLGPHGHADQSVAKRSRGQSRRTLNPALSPVRCYCSKPALPCAPGPERISDRDISSKRRPERFDFEWMKDESCRADRGRAGATNCPVSYAVPKP